MDRLDNPCQIAPLLQSSIIFTIQHLMPMTSFFSLSPRFASVVVAFLCAVPAFAAEPVDLVNVFLGSDSSAQCSPAAIQPFGMISPGPFNRPSAPCGYAHRNKTLLGFNHTHLQGTGCGSYGVITLLPVSSAKELGATVKSSPEKRAGEPGYFKAELDDEGITAEMTCTKRAAIHRYSFPEGAKTRRVLLDVSQAILYTGKGEFDGKVAAVGDRALEGYARTTAWGEHKTWFYMEFNKPFRLDAKEGKGEKLPTSSDGRLRNRSGPHRGTLEKNLQSPRNRRMGK